MSASPPPLFDVDTLQVHFKGQRRRFMERPLLVRAVEGVTFTIQPGEAFGIVGESGAGKTVLLRTMVKLIRPTAGTVLFEGRSIQRLDGQALFEFRRRVQLMFQNPYTALHPRMTVREILTEPLRIHHLGSHQEQDARAAETLQVVGLNPSYLARYPHQFSGGQRQRIGIARALVSNPQVLLCDEPVSALDVSIQAQVLNLFQDLKQRFSLTYLIIAHDLSVVRFLCNRIAVMYRGRFVEIAPTEELFSDPQHPYTRDLIRAVPTIQRGIRGEKIAIDGVGRDDRYDLEHAILHETSPGHLVAGPAGP